MNKDKLKNKIKAGVAGLLLGATLLTGAACAKNDDKELLNTDGSNNLLKVIKAIYGIDVTKKMLFVEGENNDYKVKPHPFLKPLPHPDKLLHKILHQRYFHPASALVPRRFVWTGLPLLQNQVAWLLPVSKFCFSINFKTPELLYPSILSAVRKHLHIFPSAKPVSIHSLHS